MTPIRPETWIFSRGRWKIISERSLTLWIVTGFIMCWVTGFVCGIGLVDVLIERRLVPIRREIARIESEVDAAVKAGGVALMPIRPVSEIQRAHDILVALVIGDVPVRVPNEELPRAALDVLCWVLRHEHNTRFASNLADVESSIVETGMSLIDHGKPVVRFDCRTHEPGECDGTGPDCAERL